VAKSPEDAQLIDDDGPAAKQRGCQVHICASLRNDDSFEFLATCCNSRLAGSNFGGGNVHVTAHTDPSQFATKQKT
jgi:hypothetical protein